jgi:hypothetical protein
LLEVPLRAAGVLTAVLEIFPGHDPKGADCGEHPALGAVDLIHAITISHWPAIAAAREVEVSREYISRVTIFHAIAVAASTSAPAAPIATVAVISCSRIVSVPHGA